MGIDEKIEKFADSLFSNENVYLIVFVDKNGEIVLSKSRLQGESVESKLLEMLKKIVKTVYDSLNKFDEIEGVLRYVTINMQSGFSLLYILHREGSLLLIAKSEKKVNYEELNELIDKIKKILEEPLEQ